MSLEMPTGGTTVHRMGSSAGGGLVEILDRVLDKGIVIDAWVSVSLVGIELLTIEARVVVASVDTYLKYADAIGVTQLASHPQPVVEAAPAVDEVAAATRPESPLGEGGPLPGREVARPADRGHGDTRRSPTRARRGQRQPSARAAQGAQASKDE